MHKLAAQREALEAFHEGLEQDKLKCETFEKMARSIATELVTASGRAQMAKAIAQLNITEAAKAEHTNLRVAVSRTQAQITRLQTQLGGIEKTLGFARVGFGDPLWRGRKEFCDQMEFIIKLLKENAKAANAADAAFAPAPGALANIGEPSLEPVAASAFSGVEMIDEVIWASQTPMPKKDDTLWMSPYKKIGWIPSVDEPVHFVSLSARGILCFGSRDSPTLHIVDMRTQHVVELDVGHGAFGCEYEGTLFMSARGDMNMRHTPIEDVLMDAGPPRFGKFPLPRPMGSSARLDMAHQGWIVLEVDESPNERILVQLKKLHATIAISQKPVYSVGGATGIDLGDVQFFGKRGYDCFSVAKTGAVTKLCRLVQNCVTVIPSMTRPQHLKDALFIDEQMNATHKGVSFPKLQGNHMDGQNIVRLHQNVFLFQTGRGEWAVRRIRVP